MALLPYAPLFCKSNGSFLEGASHPEELVEETYRLGLSSLALTDRDGVYGIVRAHLKALELGVHLVSDGGTKPYRAHFRDPSFNNLQSLSILCEGGQLADVVVALASLDPVLGGVDR